MSLDPAATIAGTGPGPASLVAVFLAGAVTALVGLVLCVCAAVWWIKATVLNDSRGPNPKPTKPNTTPGVSPHRPPKGPKPSGTSSSRRALELLLRDRDAKENDAFSSTMLRSASGSTSPTKSGSTNQLMGWLNVYRVPIQSNTPFPNDAMASNAPADAVPTAPTTTTTTSIDTARTPSSPIAPPSGYVGAGHQYAALHRPRSLAASSERLPGALSSSNPDLTLWPPLATSPPPPPAAASAAAASAAATSASSTNASISSSASVTIPPVATSSRRSSATFASTPHTRAFERAKSPTCFGVLRHHSLFLYDDETLLDCVGVILLPLHSVALHAPPGAAQGRVPWDDSECYAKDTPIRLSRVGSGSGASAGGLSRSKDAWDPVMAGIPLVAGGGSESHLHPGVEQRDFFLYAMNAVEKEAWYLALRRASATGTHESTHPPSFHSSYSALRSALLATGPTGAQSPTLLPLDPSTLWLNALVGRGFLTMQDHPLLTRYLMTKFTKKLDRLPSLPGFLSSLRVASVDPGSAAPLVTNPALVRCDATGHVEVELDVAYTGGARVQLAADVVLSLGTTVASIAGKLGAGDGVAADLRVPVVLGVTLAELRGRLRVALRPPPSNRAWVGFVDAPKLVVKAEPVVNTKQLRLAMVLDLIESKVRDLLVASMVLPNMEDVCLAPSGWGQEAEGAVEGGRFYPKVDKEHVASTGRPESVRSMATSTMTSSTGSAGVGGTVGRERSRSITSMWSAMSSTSGPIAAAAPLSPRTRLSTIPASPADTPHSSMSSSHSHSTRGMVAPLPPRPTTSTSLCSPPTTLSRSSTASSSASSASSLSPWTSLASSTLTSPGSEYPRSVKRGFGVVHHDDDADEMRVVESVPPMPSIPSQYVADGDGDKHEVEHVSLRHRRAYSASVDSVPTTATSRVVAAAGAGAASVAPGSSKSSASTSSSAASSFSFRSLFRSSSSGDDRGGQRASSSKG